MNVFSSFCLSLIAACQPVTYHVFPPGREAPEGAFTSIAAARDAIRAQRAAGEIDCAVEVQLDAGMYNLAEPLVFGPEDGGTEDAPVTYRAAPGEEVVISGGVAVTDWELAGEDRWSAPWPEGVENIETLWINGRRATVARTPDAGSYLHTAGKVAEAPQRAFLFAPDDARHFRDTTHARLIAFHSWETSTHAIASVDFDAHAVTFGNDAHWEFERWGEKQRYYIENTAEACDAPGEWYADPETRRIEYLPLPDEDLATLEAVVPVLSQLLLLQGRPDALVSYLNFEDIQFRHTDYLIGDDGHSDAQAAFTVSAAIDFSWARHCALRRTGIEHTGGYGLWFNSGTQHCTLQETAMKDLGAGGVRIGASSAPVGGMEGGAHIPAHNVIDNNILHNGGRKFHAGVGVWIGHAHHTDVTHNDIGDFYYTGVSNGWVWGYGDNPSHHNRIEYNHIHQIGQGVLSDMGGIYNLGVQPGSTNRYNRIHDITSFHYGGWGLYTDEGSTGILLENNIVYNTNDGSFHQHYGKENIVRNNILVHSETEQIKVTRVEAHRSLTFERNIVVSNNGRVCPINWGKADIVSDYNLYWDTAGNALDFGGMGFETWQRASGRDSHSVIADPRFADLAAHDFSLDADSPAYALGFEAIDTKKIGIYGDGPWLRRLAKKNVVFRDGFEEVAEGALPRMERVYGITADAGVRVSRDHSADGTHSIQITDAAGKQRSHEPELAWITPAQDGRAACRFSVWPEADTALRVVLRDRVADADGPWWACRADGVFETAGGVLDIPAVEGWHSVELAVDLAASPPTFDCYQRSPGGDVAELSGMPLPESAFQTVGAIHLEMPGDHGTVYLDRLQLTAYE